MSEQSKAKIRCRSRAAAIVLAAVAILIFWKLSWDFYIYASLVAIVGVLFRLRNENSDRKQVAGAKMTQALIGEDRVVGYVLGIVAAVVFFLRWYVTQTP
jgi:uncharacterized membrane protein YgaE (UPF0421/DUF939 family)